jgi:transcriptional regulator with XRE-family HTH domain
MPLHIPPKNRSESLIRKSLSETKPRSPVAADKKMGDRIRARRIELGMTQETLAAHLGVSFQQVQKYEKGVNRVHATRLNVIAKFLDMQVENFFNSDQAPAVTSLIDVTDKSMVRMLQAYGRIKDQATQRQMVMLVEAIAVAADQ